MLSFFYIEFLTSYSTSLKMLHFVPNPTKIGHLVTELLANYRLLKNNIKRKAFGHYFCQYLTNSISNIRLISIVYVYIYVNVLCQQDLFVHKYANTVFSVVSALGLKLPPTFFPRLANGKFFFWETGH